MADQTTDPVIAPEVTLVDQPEEESIFGTPNLEPLVTEPVVPVVTDESKPIKDTAADADDKILVQTLSDNGIATLQEVKKLFERVQVLEEDNKKLIETLATKNREISELQAKIEWKEGGMEDQEIKIGELKKEVASLNKTLQTVRQGASKNIFTKWYTISDDVLSEVKSSTK